MQLVTLPSSGFNRLECAPQQLRFMLQARATPTLRPEQESPREVVARGTLLELGANDEAVR